MVDSYSRDASSHLSSQPINLPYEILATILGELDSFRDIKNVSLVSRALRAPCLPFLFDRVTILPSYVDHQEEESKLEELEFYAQTASRWLKTIRVKDHGQYEWIAYPGQQSSRQSKLVRRIFGDSAITRLSIGLHSSENGNDLVSFLGTQDLTSVKTLKLEDVGFNAMTASQIRTILGFMPQCRKLHIVVSDYRTWPEDMDDEVMEQDVGSANSNGYLNLFMHPLEAITHIHLNLLSLPSNFSTATGLLLENITHLTIGNEETFPAIVDLLGKISQAGRESKITNLSVVIPDERKRSHAEDPPPVAPPHQISLEGIFRLCPRLTTVKLKLCWCAYEGLGLLSMPATVEIFHLDIPLLDFRELHHLLTCLLDWLGDPSKISRLKEVVIKLDWQYAQEEALWYEADESLLEAALEPTYLREYHPELYKRYPSIPSCEELEDWKVKELFMYGNSLQHAIESVERDVMSVEILALLIRILTILNTRSITYKLDPPNLKTTYSESSGIFFHVVKGFINQRKVRDRCPTRQLTLYVYSTCLTICTVNIFAVQVALAGASGPNIPYTNRVGACT